MLHFVYLYCTTLVFISICRNSKNKTKIDKIFTSKVLSLLKNILCSVYRSTPFSSSQIFSTLPTTPLELTQPEGTAKQNSSASVSSSSTPKSSPTPTSHSPSGVSHSVTPHLAQVTSSKSNQPVLQVRDLNVAHTIDFRRMGNRNVLSVLLHTICLVGNENELVSWHVKLCGAICCTKTCFFRYIIIIHFFSFYNEVNLLQF